MPGIPAFMYICISGTGGQVTQVSVGTSDAPNAQLNLPRHLQHIFHTRQPGSDHTIEIGHIMAASN